jgi:hypothetical protein
MEISTMAQVSFSHILQLRRNAKRLAQSQNLTHSQALDQVARVRGYGNWSQLMKHAEQEAPAFSDAAPAPQLTPAEVQQALGMPKLVATRDERKIIMAIAKRFAGLVGDAYEIHMLSILMDIEACHCNGCPLDLVGLLEASRDEDLAHDVGGISRYLNRDTGKLEGWFTPRYASHNVITPTAGNA